MDTRVRFIHRRPTIDGKITNSGGCTVAYREVDDGIEYAVAYCSPRDNFSRKIGRAKAGGRLNSDKHKAFERITLTEFKNSWYESEIE